MAVYLYFFLFGARVEVFIAEKLIDDCHLISFLLIELSSLNYLIIVFWLILKLEKLE